MAENLEEPLSEELVDIDVESIVPNRYQPRSSFNEAAIKELAENIQHVGLISPIRVREIEDGKFELIAGERRWRAVKQLGWEYIACILSNETDQEVAEKALAENIQRQELNPVEESKAIQNYMHVFEIDNQKEVAVKVGRNRTYVSQSLNLLQMPKDVLELVETGKLSRAVALTLLKIPDQKARSSLAKTFSNTNVTSRKAETLVEQHLAQQKTETVSKAKGKPASKEPNEPTEPPKRGRGRPAGAPNKPKNIGETKEPATIPVLEPVEPPAEPPKSAPTEPCDCYILIRVDDDEHRSEVLESLHDAELQTWVDDDLKTKVRDFL